MEFKDRLRGLREDKKISAAQLAAAFNKSEGAIRMWETGRTKPDADTLIKLAKYFGCSADYLLGLADFTSPEYQVAYNELGLSPASISALKSYAQDIASGSSLAWVIDEIIQSKHYETFAEDCLIVSLRDEHLAKIVDAPIDYEAHEMSPAEEAIFGIFKRNGRITVDVLRSVFADRAKRGLEAILDEVREKSDLVVIPLAEYEELERKREEIEREMEGERKERERELSEMQTEQGLLEKRISELKARRGEA